MFNRPRTSFLFLVLLAASAFGQDGPGAGAHLPSQAAADALRAAASTDGAFIAAGLVKDSFQKDNLASLLQVPTDEVSIVNLTGSQVRQAFERSLSLYPMSNGSFLQISGFEVTFNRNGAPGSRIVSVTANGSKLEDAHSYSVAMPSSLGRGGLGYFKIWDREKVARSLPGATVESVLRGKAYSETSPRWISQG